MQVPNRVWIFAGKYPDLRVNDRQLRGGDASSKRVRSYRVLLGQYHLMKVIAAQKQPASAYRDDLRAYADSVERLIAETRGMAEYPIGSPDLSDEDENLAEELGSPDRADSTPTAAPGHAGQQG